MNSKERVRNAVWHLPSDQVPTLYGDMSWLSLSNTRTNRQEGGFLDEWGVINIPRDGMYYGERLHPVTTIAGLVRTVNGICALQPSNWDERAARLRRE